MCKFAYVFLFCFYLIFLQLTDDKLKASQIHTQRGTHTAELVLNSAAIQSTLLLLQFAVK